MVAFRNFLRITDRYNIHIDTQHEFIYIYNHVVSLYRTEIDLTSIAIKLEHATQSFKPFSRHDERSSIYDSFPLRNQTAQPPVDKSFRFRLIP
jgi:uncharacterized protein YpuA (DUF1002 family)